MNALFLTLLILLLGVCQTDFVQRPFTTGKTVLNINKSQSLDKAYFTVFPRNVFLGEKLNVTIFSRTLPVKLAIVSKLFEFRGKITTSPQPVTISLPPKIYSPLKDYTLKMNVTIIGVKGDVVIEKNKVVKIDIVREEPMIISESSKPIYKPGELVKVRFLALDANRLTKFGDEAKFEYIKISDPLGKVFYFQKGVNWKKALHVSVALDKYCKQGKWSAVAKMKGTTEWLTFQVKQYVLPKFVVDIKAPKRISLKDEIVKFQVCAKYGTEMPMKGTIKVFICNKSWKTSKCVTVTKDIPSETICTEFFIPGKQILSLPSGHLSIKAIVTEDGTQEKIERTSSMAITFHTFEITQEGSDTVKPGLPYVLKISTKYLNGNAAPYKNLSLSIRKGSDYVPYFWYFRWPGYKKQFLTDAKGKASIVVPFLPSASEIYIDISGEPDGRRSFKTVKVWKSVTSQTLQIVNPFTETMFTCQGETVKVKLNLQSSYPINLIPLYISLSSTRGQKHVTLKAERARMPCLSRNDDLGRFNCLEDEVRTGAIPKIKCLKGYHGPRCSSPICSHNCNGHGICSDIDECWCNTGWTGMACDQCVARKGCQNGYCVNGDDCVCYKGYFGYNCLKKGIMIQEENSNTVKSRKNNSLNPTSYVITMPLAFFERKINLDIPLDMTLDTRVTVYFNYLGNNTNNSEIIGDQLTLPILRKCYKLKNDKITDGGFEFVHSNKAPFATPRDKILLKLNASKGSLCNLKISDITLKNYGAIHTKSHDDVLNYMVVQNELRNSNGVHDQFYTCPFMYIRNFADMADQFAKGGFVVLSNIHFINRKCIKMKPVMYNTLNKGIPPPDLENAPVPEAKNKKTVKKILIRTFFPETWKFETISNLKNNVIPLTVPDSLTTWIATAYCVNETAIWFPPATNLTVKQAFYIEPSLPFSIKRGESVLIPIKIINYIKKPKIAVRLNISVSDKYLRIVGSHIIMIDVKGFEEKTVFTKIQARAVSPEAFIQIFATTVGTSKGDLSHGDAIKKNIRIVYEGVTREIVITNFTCVKSGEKFKFQSVLPRFPKDMILTSLSSYMEISNNVFGSMLKNLDSLVTVPYGCGEQNMITLVPSIYVRKYLLAQNDSSEETAKLLDQTRKYIVSGVNRQEKFRHSDGSYSAFGPSKRSMGSTWLSAFVYRSFKEISALINDVVNPTELKNTMRFLQSKVEQSDGCYNEDANVFSQSIKGAAANDKQNERRILTAYILMSLDASPKDNYKAISCLTNYIQTELNKDSELSTMKNYGLALMALALEHQTPKHPLCNIVRRVLWQRGTRVVHSNELYFKDPSDKVNYQNRYSTYSMVETTAYAYLALRNTKSTNEMLPLIRWLSNQRNSLGGYYSTQDTVVALNALSTYMSSIESSNVANMQVRVFGMNKNYYLKLFKEISLRYDRFKVTPHSVNVEALGTGCLLYSNIYYFNVKDKNVPSRSFKISWRQLGRKTSERFVENLLCVAWNLKNRKPSSMITATIEQPTGWKIVAIEPHQNATGNKPSQVDDSKRSQITLYYDSDVDLEKCIEIRFKNNLITTESHPSLIKVVDYYTPENFAEFSYNLVSFDEKLIVNQSTEQVPKPTLPKEKKTCPIYVTDKSQRVVQQEFYNDICTTTSVGIINLCNLKAPKSQFYSGYYRTYYMWNATLYLKHCQSNNTVLQKLSNCQGNGAKGVVVLSNYWLSTFHEGSSYSLINNNTRVYSLAQVMPLLTNGTLVFCQPLTSLVSYVTMFSLKNSNGGGGKRLVTFEEERCPNYNYNIAVKNKAFHKKICSLNYLQLNSSHIVATRPFYQIRNYTGNWVSKNVVHFSMKVQALYGIQKQCHIKMTYGPAPLALFTTNEKYTKVRLWKGAVESSVMVLDGSSLLLSKVKLTQYAKRHCR